jgi:hypothetical protein
MVNEPKNHDPALDAVEAKILRERDELLAKRAHLMEQRAALLTELRQADRRLADCRATARFFGLTIDFPEDEAEQIGRIDRQRVDRERALRMAERELEMRRSQIEEMKKRQAKVQSELVFLSPPPNQPKEPIGNLAVIPPVAAKTIREISLDRLVAAGGSGTKAAAIREFYERTYGKPIHEKTVGMTLYRLQNDGLVRRDGHTWFLAPPKAEMENPGGETPGPINSDAT